MGGGGEREREVALVEACMQGKFEKPCKSFNFKTFCSLLLYNNPCLCVPLILHGFSTNSVLTCFLNNIFVDLWCCAEVPVMET